MPAPKGHPPYPGCETGGRPPKYSTEDIERFADEFLQWMKNPQNFWIKDFCLERDIDPDYMADWAKQNEKFSGAYKIAKGFQESRIFKGSMMSAYNGGMAKFALMNCHGWSEKQDTKLSGDPVNPLACLLKEVNGTSKDLVNDESE